MARFQWTTDSTVELHATSSVHPIHGDIHDVRGEAIADVGEDGTLLGGSGGFVECDTDALKSGNKLEDFELRRRLDAKKYPTIRYDVRSVDGGGGSFKVTGALTLHGVTREFVEECSARLDDGVLKVEAEHTFDIRDFGVQPPKFLKLQVHPEVRVVLHLAGRQS